MSGLLEMKNLQDAPAQAGCASRVWLVCPMFSLKRKKFHCSLSRSHEEAVFLSTLGATEVSAVTSSKLVKSEKFAFGEKDD